MHLGCHNPKWFGIWAACIVNTINEFQERNKQLLEENENLKKQLTDKDRVLNKENEIMSKILIDIILHNNNVSDEKITELLNQEDWKEKLLILR